MYDLVIAPGSKVTIPRQLVDELEIQFNPEIKPAVFSIQADASQRPITIQTTQAHRDLDQFTQRITTHIKVLTEELQRKPLFFNERKQQKRAALQALATFMSEHPDLNGIQQQLLQIKQEYPDVMRGIFHLWFTSRTAKIFDDIKQTKSNTCPLSFRHK